MKRLLTLTALAAVTVASVGCNCCGSRCFSRREECPPTYQPTYMPAQPCDPCEQGTMGAPMMTAPPTMITPGPAYSTGYLPR